MFDLFLNPDSIAVIGASREPGKVGYNTLKNLIEGNFKGPIYPVNPAADSVLGLKSYKSVLDIDGDVGMAVVIIPAKFVVDTFKDLIAKKVKAAVVITAGFKEIGGKGAEREKELSRLCKGKIRVIGPNCLGIIDTYANLNASFAPAMPPRGQIGFMSQSGALVTAILDWAEGKGMGFSKFISMGNKMDLDETHYLRMLGEDDKTRVIIGYIESVEDGETFIKVAREISRKKPIIIFKSGVSTEGIRAASSHTGALAGMDRAYECAFKKSGILRARSLEDLFDWGEVFASQPLPKGKRVAIVTNAGGPGIIATDKASEEGLTLASFNAALVGKLKEILPPAASVYNPVDVLGDATSDRYQKVLELIIQAEEVDGLLIILAPQASTQIEETAKIISDLPRSSQKAIIASFMGEHRVSKAFHILQKAGIASIPFPDRAAGALSKLAHYNLWKMEKLDGAFIREIDKEGIRKLIKSNLDGNKIKIVDYEVRDLLSCCKIPVLPSTLSYTPEEAANYAREIGFPVVMKVYSPEILHKTDVGGVRINIRTPEEASRAFEEIMINVKRYLPQAPVSGITVQKMVEGGKEVITGFSRDPQFGPLLMFGLGGVYVEVLKDVNFALPPLSLREIKELVSGIKSFPLLTGVRGEKEKDLDALYDVIAAVASLGLNFPEIMEMEINPLIVKDRGEGVWAVDGRIILREK
ncbi:MAG: acetate--CoA ligase family protein [Dehalococcoidia bacterium]|nr:acetate--CoA ligase family protein [Dehalococcoidia bacterium]